MASTIFPVGVLLQGNEVEKHLAMYAADGAEIVQLWCTAGELAPENFSPAHATRLLKRCEMLGLSISALCGDTGLGFCNAAKVQEAYDKTVKYADVARELGVRVVTSHIGHFTSDPAARKTGVESLKRLGDQLAKRDVHFATETGAEDGPDLRTFLDDVGHPNIAVNFDPANMLYRGFDVERAVRLLGPAIVHSHAKDRIHKGPEVPIGQGDVPWPRYLHWLREAGFTGAMAVEREGGDTFREDARQGMNLIKRWRSQLP